MDHQVIVIANSKSEEELNLQQDNNANDKVLSPSMPFILILWAGYTLWSSRRTCFQTPTVHVSSFLFCIIS